MYGVFLADDEPSVIEGLKIMIDWAGQGFEICGEAREAREALEKIPLLRPRLLITDIRMPGLNGLEMIAKLRETLPEIEIIILSGYPEFSYAQQAIRERVRHYLLKPLDTAELYEALADIKQRLDSAFYAQSPRYLAEAALYGEAGEAAFDNYADAVKSAVLQMNEAEASDIIDNMFELFERSRVNRIKARVIVNSIVYQILKAAFERNIEIDWRDIIKPGSDETPERMKARLNEIARAAIHKLLEARRQKTKLYLIEAKKYIDGHFDSEITMSELSGQVYVDQEYLGKCFKREYGCSANEYRHRLRIEKAARLLSTTDMTLNEVSLAVGYGHYNKFYDQFKKIMGKKPAEYNRRLNG